MSSTPKDSPFDGSLDEWPELLDGWFRSECEEVWRRRQSHGDESIAEKARNLLRFGAARTLQGHPPPDFTRFVAACILSHLEGVEPTLDHAFRLRKSRSGKPISGKKEAAVVEAFAGAMADNQQRSKKERVDLALLAAFQAHHGWRPAEHEDVGDRMRATRDVLRTHGRL
jgi:hypothetical protein